MAVTVTVDGNELSVNNGWYEDSWTYPCNSGGAVTILWQLYRPLLGNTVEIVTGKHNHAPIIDKRAMKLLSWIHKESAHILDTMSHASAFAFVQAAVSFQGDSPGVHVSASRLLTL
jgi:hypothetical protein